MCCILSVLKKFPMKLDEKFIQEQKTKLEKRREEILKELNIDATPSKNASNDFDAKFPEYGDKEEDNAAEVAAFGNNLSMEKNLEVSLFNVDKAIRKIKEGNYGICEKCGKPIDAKRLSAFPSATACMDCKRNGT